MIFMMQILLIVGGVGLPSQSAWDDEPRRVEFTTSDGVQIVGDFYLPKKPVEKLPAVILLHMYDSNRRAWDTLAPELQKAGLAVLAIDLRGHGESIQPANLQLETKAKNRDAKSAGDIPTQSQNRRSAADFLLRHHRGDNIRPLSHAKTHAKSHNRQRKNNIERRGARVKMGK